MKTTTTFTLAPAVPGHCRGRWCLHGADDPSLVLSFHHDCEGARLAERRLAGLPDSLLELLCRKAAKLSPSRRLALAQEVGQVLESWPDHDLEHELRLLAFNYCASMVDAAEAALALLDRRRRA